MLEQLLAYSLTQQIALVSGLIYVVLAAREQMACWLFGIISCALIAWDDFNTFKLYADGVLQIIYVGMGVYGLWQWRSGGQQSGNLQIHEKPFTDHVAAITVSVALSYGLFRLLIAYTDASYGYLDTLTSVLSLYATYLLANKVLSNWIYWIVIDIAYVFLFLRTGGDLIALLYAIFVAVAILGFFNWRRKYRASQVD